MFPVHLLAVFVAAITAHILGALWYSPLLFGTIWIRLSGMTKADLDKAKSNGMGKTYLISFLTTLVMAYVLAILLSGLQITSLSRGIGIGFLLWLGFIVPTLLGGVLWKNESYKLFTLNAMHYLAAMLLMGAILVVWT